MEAVCIYLKLLASGTGKVGRGQTELSLPRDKWRLATLDMEGMKSDDAAFYLYGRCSYRSARQRCAIVDAAL